MPVKFKIDDASGSVFAEARGIVSFAELVDYITAKEEQGLMGLPELFDARDTTLDLSVSDLETLSSETAEALGTKVAGRVSVVTNSAFIYGLAQAYAVLARQVQPTFAIFKDAQEARIWLLGSGAHRESNHQESRAAEC